MKIVAFLQNPWFPPGTERGHIERYITDQEFHQRLLRRTMSGHRLIEAFGEQFFSRVWWDNVCPTPTDRPDGLGKPDPRHVDNVLGEINPQLIITFGKQAYETIERAAGAINRKVMSCHHPNARYKTQTDLNKFAYSVMVWVKEQETYQ